MSEKTYTPEYLIAREQEQNRRRHIENCTKKLDECGICFADYVFSMRLQRTGLERRFVPLNRAEDEYKYAGVVIQKQEG